MNPDVMTELEVLEALAYGRPLPKDEGLDEFLRRFGPALSGVYTRMGVSAEDNSLRQQLVTEGLGNHDEAINSFMDYLLTGGRTWLSMQEGSRRSASENVRPPIERILDARPGQVVAYLCRTYRSFLSDVFDKLTARKPYLNTYDPIAEPTERDPVAEPTKRGGVRRFLQIRDPSPDPSSQFDEPPRRAVVAELLYAARALKDKARSSTTLPAETAGVLADFFSRVIHGEDALKPDHPLLEASTARRLAYWAAQEMGIDNPAPAELRELEGLSVQALLDQIVAAHFQIDLSNPGQRDLIQKRRGAAFKSVRESAGRQAESLAPAQRSPHLVDPGRSLPAREGARDQSAMQVGQPSEIES